MKGQQNLQHPNDWCRFTEECLLRNWEKWQKGIFINLEMEADLSFTDQTLIIRDFFFEYWFGEKEKNSCLYMTFHHAADLKIFVVKVF